MSKNIEIRGARENNLKNINLSIPKNKLVFFTGLSGSGKSSLAFDTLFAEGQRRYMESLSSYARQFLGQMQKPDVDSIDGLSPAIAIDQKTTSNNPRSTVGTITEIHDYLRLLFANVGTPFCPNCGKEIKSVSVDVIVDKIMLKKDKKIMVISPVIRGRKGEYKTLFDGFLKAGYVRTKVDGVVYSIEDVPPLEKNKKHDISVVVDRLIVREDIKSRLAESLETALKLADGLVIVDIKGDEQLFSTNHSCTECGFSFDEIAPRLFSFNTPFGACPNCMGLGYKQEISEDILIPDKTLSIKDGAIKAYGWGDGGMSTMFFEAIAKKYGFSLTTPIKDLPPKILNLILYGNNGEKLDFKYKNATFSGEYKGAFEGVIPNLKRRYKETTSDFSKAEIEKYMVTTTCDMCNGRRLNKNALSVLIDGKNIADISDLPVSELYAWIESLTFTKTQLAIAGNIVKEIKARLNFLINVGLSYLSLSRAAGTLSGGEAQRIRLATQIGSALTGVMYILDEPSIGLHPKDTKKLLSSLKELRDLGNSLIVVEHDEDSIRSADYIVDVGPKAGIHGGEIVACGSVDDIMACDKSITGQYLSGKRKISVPVKRRKQTDKKLVFIGCSENNLKNQTIEIPLGLFVAVSGVSGSGKSSFINGIVHPAIHNYVFGGHLKEGKYEKVLGMDNIDKIVTIDQSPIGRTPRSNPATYIGLFNYIRDLFSTIPEAKAKGYGPGRFSFNIKGGRCENCGGDGVHKIEMHFLPDVYVECDVCHGKRYNRETLEIKFKGANISDVLDMTVEKALKFFENHEPIKNKLQTLFDVGLGYIKLGQPATTLSGGEAQRVKLASELSKRQTGKTLYLLDEPTTGLHTYDVDKLINILQRLVSSGNTVVVIEHNLELLKVVDHIIDLGPEGGDKGGRVVAVGTPESLVNNKKSVTGEFLKDLIQV